MHKALKIPLPTLPTIAIRLLELFDDSNVELREVVELLRSDPAIASRIIKAANSSAYGMGREVIDLQQAISLLGKTVVTSLALSFSLSERSMQPGTAAELFRSYWLQAMTQAVTAECLAQRYGRKQTGEWFITGLLGSIGRLSLISHDPDLYAHVVSHADALRVPLHDAEESLFGTTTIGLSVELLTLWNLPRRCVNAVAHQLQAISDSDYTNPGYRFEAAIAVSTSVGEFFCQNCKGQSLIQIVHIMEEAFDATEDDVSRLIDSVRNRLDATSDLFQVDCSSLGSPAELMSIAMQHLSSLATLQSTSDPVNESIMYLAQQNERLLERVQRLTVRSTTDSLTGLFNRGFFEDRFQEHVAAFDKTQAKTGLIFIDIDHFKRVNDTYGHLAGDEILRQVAAVIRNNVRSSDIAARFGGEEFVILVPKAEPDVISMLAERIRRAIENTIIQLKDDCVQVTVSVGAAIGCPEVQNKHFCANLIATTDNLLYEAKRNGRNRVCIAQSLHNELLPIAPS
ncbi:MAG: GGDEF domain-containing protein [Planctomycetaceae bacterium]|nr:GGDEF domain-containing protein [Planctomycetaceae bacterium]